MALVSANLLTIVNRAEDELGLSRSTGITGTPTEQARQMLGLINSLGADLLDSHDWSALTTLGTVTTVAGQAAYDLPADYRSLVDGTPYDVSRRWPVDGPTSPRDATALRAGSASAPGVQRFRVVRGQLGLWPAPSASGSQVTYEYQSGSWVRTTAGVAVGSVYVADTDVTFWRTSLLVAGLKLKFLRARGFDTSYAQEDYDRIRSRAISDDLGSRTISMAPSNSRHDDDGLGGVFVVLPAS